MILGKIFCAVVAALFILACVLVLLYYFILHWQITGLYTLLLLTVLLVIFGMTYLYEWVSK